MLKQDKRNFYCFCYKQQNAFKNILITIGFNRFFIANKFVLFFETFVLGYFI